MSITIKHRLNYTIESTYVENTFINVIFITFLLIHDIKLYNDNKNYSYSMSTFSAYEVLRSIYVNNVYFWNHDYIVSVYHILIRYVLYV